MGVSCRDVQNCEQGEDAIMELQDGRSQPSFMKSECSGLTEEYDFASFATEIAAARTGDQVWRLLDSICRKSNISGACCRCFPSEAAADPIIFFSKTTDFSSELEAVLEDTPGYLDPFLHASVRSTRPFNWSEISQHLGARSPQLKHFQTVIAQLGTGIVVPVFGPLFRNGYFCFHSEEARTLEALDLMVLHSISQTAYLKLLDLMYKSASHERTLSGRELETINMIARGKSNQEVAKTLDVSVNTVNTHLKRIFEKLDVTDRVSAAMRAYALGYIA
ncbi:MAG: helix-turn-helix transcriptional regulator [Henriciella sp.]